MLPDFSTKNLRVTCKASCFHRVNFEHYKNNLDNPHRIQFVSATIQKRLPSAYSTVSMYVCLYLCLYMHMHAYIHKFCSDIYVCLTHPVCDCVCVCVACVQDRHYPRRTNSPT